MEGSGRGHALLELGARDADDALHRRQGQRVEFGPGTDDQRLGDCQREGQTQREGGALPALGGDGQRATQFRHLIGHHVHADAAAGSLGELVCGAEARAQDELHGLLVRQRGLLADEAELDGLPPDREHVEPATVVGDVDDDLGALAPDRDADRARGRLAHHLALGGGLEAVDHRVAQHVLEGWQHLLEDLPVQVAAADDAELGELPLVLRRLAHQAGEPGAVLVERHHPGAHQLVLQLGGGPGLLDQQPFRVGAEVMEQVLDAAHVARRLREAPRQLLDGGVPVQLQRVEIAFLPGLGLVAVQDLGLGLDLELAQLVPEADDGLVEFVQVELDLRELLAQAGIRDADLASAVQQLLQQAGIHAGKVPGFGRTLAGRGWQARLGGGWRQRRSRQERLGRLGRGRCFQLPREFAQTLERGRNGGRQGWPGRRQGRFRHRSRLQVGQQDFRVHLVRYPGGLHTFGWRRLGRKLQLKFGLGLDHDLKRDGHFRHGLGRQLRCRLWLLRRHFVTAQRSGQARQQGGSRRRRNPRGDFIPQDVQFIECCLDQAVGACPAGQQAVGHAQQERLQVVTQVAHGKQAGHARSALQGVQPALELGHGLRFILAGRQARDGKVAALQDLAGLLGEDGGDFCIPARRGTPGGHPGLDGGLDGGFGRRFGFQQEPWLWLGFRGGFQFQAGVTQIQSRRLRRPR